MGSNEWAATHQGVTTITADHHYERWTREEVEFVVEHTDSFTDEELAILLGRTLYAVWGVQHRIKTEGVAGVLESFSRPAPRPTCGSCFMEILPTGDCPNDC